MTNKAQRNNKNLFILIKIKIPNEKLNNLIYIKIISKLKGDGGLGMGDWGLGIGPNPQSPIPNPQSPIPNPQELYFFILINL